MNVLVIESESDPNDPLWADLGEAGHSARTRAEAGISGGAVPEASAADGAWTPDVFLVRLDHDAAALLDETDLIARARRFAGAAILFTGGNELALTAARRRFPQANFARGDQVLTALASIEFDDA